MALGHRFGSKQELAFHLSHPSVAKRDILTRIALPPAAPLKLVFRLLARLPLATNQALGAAIGTLVYLFSPRFRLRTRENLGASGIAAGPDLDRLARANAAEIGKGATELAWALFRADEAIARVREAEGWEHVERLRAAGRPIVFVTPD